MRKINPLHPGDTVALAATARKVSPEEITPAVKLLESWGLRVLLPEGLFAEDHQFAGNDLHRAKILQSLLDDPQIKAIFCVRGGYGTVRILDLLDFTRFTQSPKWLVGYSDVTALHSHINKKTSLPTLHAVMPINITEQASSDSRAITTLRKCLFDATLCYHFVNEMPEKNRVGECCAPIVGGNLSVLYSLLGSESDVDTDGKILFIEDLDEYLYHIDRMMVALRRAGKLAGLKGLIVGAFSDMHDNAVPFGRSANQIILEAVADYAYPVALNCPVGHIGLQNTALPLGVEVEMKVAENEIDILANWN